MLYWLVGVKVVCTSGCTGYVLMVDGCTDTDRWMYKCLLHSPDTNVTWSAVVGMVHRIHGRQCFLPVIDRLGAALPLCLESDVATSVYH